jgi:hypothetical protein
MLDTDREALQVAVRHAFEFAAFLSRLPAVEAVTPTAEQMAKRILQGLDKSYGLRAIATDLVGERALNAYEDIEYTNETIVSGSEFDERIQMIASRIAGDMDPIPLQWHIYPDVVVLTKEYSAHFETLRAVESTGPDRIYALLNTIRLQITFLANTFCIPKP